MKSNEAFPSEYLKIDDIAGTGEAFTMGAVFKETFTDPKTREESKKPVLHFKETEKKLILNKTNWTSIAHFYGDDSDGWMGKKIVLFISSVDAFGKTSDVIRIDEKATKELA